MSRKIDARLAQSGPQPCRSLQQFQRFGYRWGRLLTSVIVGLVVWTTALTSHADEPGSAASQSSGNQVQQIDINTADARQLATLPGIGPAKAEAVVAYRARRPFRRIEEILRVRGIGRAIFRSIRDRITVGTPPSRQGARSRR